MKLSQEQEKIVQAAKDGKNIVCNAVAGSGKTSTVLEIAKQLESKKILQITYNRKLKQEVRKKVKEANIENMRVTNYHALCLRYYDDHTDNGMIDIIRGNKTYTSIPEKLYDLLIIDEAQDMTPEYYQFLRVFSKTHCIPNFQLIILGDDMQSVYDFKLANPEYLTHAQRYWPEHRLINLKISTSFRISPEVSECVNLLNGYKIISSAKESLEIKVTLVSSYGCGCPKELRDLADDILSDKIRASDLMIIVPSVDCIHATSLVNKLSAKNIPIYRQSDSEDASNEKYAKGKVLFCTYHTCKGLERDTVVMFNFDRTYYTIYQPDKLPTKLTPTYYVGMTRALRRLYLVENGDRLPYLSNKALGRMNVIKSNGTPKEFKNRPREKFTVTKLIKFLPVQILYEIDKEIAPLFSVTRAGSSYLKIKADITESYGRKEYVADLTGTAIGELLEYRATGNCKVLEEIEMFENSKFVSKSYIEEQLNDIGELNDYLEDDKRSEMEYFLRLCTLHEMCRSGHICRFRQITQYDWITDRNRDKILKRLEFIPKKSEFRRTFGRELTIKDRKISVIGELDVCKLHGEYKSVVEIKCVKGISTEHKLQLLIYAWILLPLIDGWKEIEFSITNVMTGEILKLETDSEIIEKLAERIVQWKIIKS